MQGRSHIFKIHAVKMSVEKDIRFELLARLCPNSTGIGTDGGGGGGISPRDVHLEGFAPLPLSTCVSGMG